MRHLCNRVYQPSSTSTGNRYLGQEEAKKVTRKWKTQIGEMTRTKMMETWMHGKNRCKIMFLRMKAIST